MWNDKKVQQYLVYVRIHLFCHKNVNKIKKYYHLRYDESERKEATYCFHNKRDDGRKPSSSTLGSLLFTYRPTDRPTSLSRSISPFCVALTTGKIDQIQVVTAAAARTSRNIKTITFQYSFFVVVLGTY